MPTSNRIQKPAGGSEGRKRILLIDDQVEVCNAIRRLLRQDGYEVHTAAGADEALAVLESQPIDIVLSDQQMPGMTGTDLLYEVQRRYPDTVRMILSGAADVDVVAKAMQEGAIYKFLTKPINPTLLRANVSEAGARIDSLREVSAGKRSFSDTVSGLPTRAYLRGLFDELTVNAVIERKTPLLFLLQIDQHDNVVSSFGQSLGRQLASRVAKLLHKALGSEWLLGHESQSVLILLTAGRYPLKVAAGLDHKLNELFSRPLEIGGQEITATVSVGATIADEVPDFDQLVDRARAAMKRCAESRGETVQFYRPELIENYRGRLRLESDLRQAVADQAFHVFYQPQVDLTSGRIVGVEALVRWRHPAQGIVSPAEFIPVAEEIGLIQVIGAFVLETVAHQLLAWLEAGYGPDEIAVNVSPLQLKDPAFADNVAAVADRLQLPKRRLVLEITESAVITEDATVGRCLERLAAAGFMLAIDDFGTGYANLSHLTQSPFQQIKIDRSLLPRRDIKSARLFANIVTMARQLGLSVVAEGIETVDDLVMVRAAGCNVVQGYYFSPPVDTERMGELLSGSARGEPLWALGE